MLRLITYFNDGDSKESTGSVRDYFNLMGMIGKTNIATVQILTVINE